MAARTGEQKRIPRDKRISRVFSVLSKTEPKPLRQVAEEAGFSEALTRSTLRLINRSTVEDGLGKALVYVPRVGWKIARGWNEKRAYVRWLHRHITTRVQTESRQVDVACALFGERVPIELAFRLHKVIEDLDACGEFLPAPVNSNPVKAPGRKRVIG